MRSGAFPIPWYCKIDSMQGTHIVAPIICGCAAIALGVIPGLLSGLMDGLHDSFAKISPMASRPSHTSGNERMWFVIVGILFLLLALSAYLSQ